MLAQSAHRHTLGHGGPVRPETPHTAATLGAQQSEDRARSHPGTRVTGAALLMPSARRRRRSLRLRSCVGRWLAAGARLSAHCRPAGAAGAGCRCTTLSARCRRRSTMLSARQVPLHDIVGPAAEAPLIVRPVISARQRCPPLASPRQAPLASAPQAPLSARQRATGAALPSLACRKRRCRRSPARGRRRFLCTMARRRRRSQRLPACR